MGRHLFVVADDCVDQRAPVVGRPSARLDADTSDIGCAAIETSVLLREQPISACAQHVTPARCGRRRARVRSLAVDERR